MTYIIETPNRQVCNTDRNVYYLYKGYPRRGRTYDHCTFTPQIKYARKFKSSDDAKMVLDAYTPSIFDGSEKIISV
jgi:hypothetical protein